jgi:hypothetical protein
MHVRKALDEVLAKEITSLIDIDSKIALEAYNLTTIASIIVAIEREREIVNFFDSPPERFTRKTFISELFEIGISDEDQLDDDLTSLIEMGYLRLTDKGEIQAEASAYTMAGFLNAMFPGMQGMNLVAFVIQMNDEVITGRKSLELAKKSFAQTLKSRGVAVTREKAEAAARAVKGPRETAEAQALSGNRAVSGQLKESAARRIASLRSRRSSSRPSVYSSTGHGVEHSKIKDVFDKGPTDEELAAEEARQRAEQSARELAELKIRLRRAEERAGQLEDGEQRLKQAREAALAAEQRARELVEQEAASMAEKKVELLAMEEKIRAAEEELRLEKEAMERAALERKKAEAQAEEDARLEEFKPELEPEPELELNDEERLESRIAAFEAELAMPCPVCRKGKIKSETTSKEKIYYTCSNSECRFVSWDKPYHFECPLCKNPFLTEFTTPTGEKGLKCPRAACSYSQNNLLPPRQNQVAEVQPVRKKKKLIKRVRRR